MNTMEMARRLAMAAALAASLTIPGVNAAWAEPAADGHGITTAPGMIAGKSPDTLGTWSVHYQRIDGGNAQVNSAINDGIDGEAIREVQQYTWDASTKRPWTFDATGTAFVRLATVSEVFIGQYNTAEPNMPLPTVATVVFDSRSGALITLDNLFRDKSAGLARLSEQATAILPTAYPPPHPGDWQRGGSLAPTDINFKNWIPTVQGIELYFPDYQFGRGLKVITVPWSEVADLIALEFLPIIQ